MTEERGYLGEILGHMFAEWKGHFSMRQQLQVLINLNFSQVHLIE